MTNIERANEDGWAWEGRTNDDDETRKQQRRDATQHMYGMEWQKLPALAVP
jgi:hypothetical protein